MLFVIRHATPVMDYSDCKFEEALERQDDYNTVTSVSLKEINAFKKSDTFDYIEKLNPKVYTSPLKRAILTSDALFDSSSIVNDLVEIDMDLVNIPYVKLKVKTWFFISRVVWLLGFNNPKEKPSDVNERITRLIKYIQPNKDTVLVTHGGVMFYLKRHPYIIRNFKLMHTETYGTLTVEVYENISG